MDLEDVDMEDWWDRFRVHRLFRDGFKFCYDGYKEDRHLPEVNSWLMDMLCLWADIGLIIKTEKDNHWLINPDHQSEKV